MGTLAIAITITAFLGTIVGFLIPYVSAEYRYWTRDAVCRRQALKSGRHPAGRKITTTTH